MNKSVKTKTDIQIFVLVLHFGFSLAFRKPNSEEI